jgi:hypothetical protein
MTADPAAAPRAKRAVVVDGGYESYDTERRVLAPFGAEIVVEPCDRDAGRVVAAIAELQAKAAEEVARVFRGEAPRHWINRWDT